MSNNQKAEVAKACVLVTIFNVIGYVFQGSQPVTNLESLGISILTAISILLLIVFPLQGRAE